MTGLVADEKGPFCLHRRRAAGNAEKAARAARVGASFRAPRGPHAEARLRGDARGRHGGVRQVTAARVVQLKPKTEVEATSILPSLNGKTARS